MTGTEIIVFSVVAVALVVFFVLGLLIFWARITHLEERAEPKALLEARVLAESTSDRVDTAVAEMRKFREGTHAEMQRFYGIMRRNERAADKAEEVEHPDVIPAADVHGPDEADPDMSRKQLRDLARQKGKVI